ncbi:CAP domain-containing protein [Roseovarius tibetensis]|uniref:CAP domain-containing protein n=1 Tax=Roseovarius tibetensis TaxID=2685897 RepID=UPI003D7FFA70
MDSERLSLSDSCALVLPKCENPNHHEIFRFDVRGLTLVVAFVLFAASSAMSAMSCTAPTNASELVQRLVQQINEERRRFGLSQFQMSPSLVRGAQIHACDNANHNRLSHIGTDGSSPGKRVLRVGYDFELITENVAIGYATAEQVLEAWLRSSTHRINIFEPRTNELGLAVARGRDGRLHWVMNGGLR